MEILVACYIVYCFFKMIRDAWNGLPERFDANRRPVYLNAENKEVYRDGTLVSEVEAEEKAEAQKEQRKTKSGKKYTVTEPDVDGCAVYSLDGGDIDDDDLIYPE